MTKLPTNALMDAFRRYCEAIRKTKPNFTRYKDGNLIKYALRHLSEFQIEMLFVWFLKQKKHMQPTIGAALSKGIINDFIRNSYKEYGFYNKLEQLAREYIKTNESETKIKKETDEMAKKLRKLKRGLVKKVKPFNYPTRAKISEETAKIERKNKH